MFRVINDWVVVNYRNLVAAGRSGTLLILLCAAFTAQADTRDQAKRIHDRIAGVPPTESVLAQMQSDIDGGEVFVNEINVIRIRISI